MKTEGFGMRTACVLPACVALCLALVPDGAAQSRATSVLAAHKTRPERTDYRETLLVPSIWCVTHPEWTGLRPPAAKRRSAR